MTDHGSADRPVRRDGYLTSSFAALGTTATIVTVESSSTGGFSTGGDTARDAPVGDATVGDAGHAAAVDALRSELHAIDMAASRFRDDSEISAVNRAGGLPTTVSDLFLEALDAALGAARLTGGLVDPTIGRALRLLGYDRDFALMDPRHGPAVTVMAQPVPGWEAVVVDRPDRTVTVPPGVELDFGATAKALCADRSARRAYAALAGGAPRGTGTPSGTGPGTLSGSANGAAAGPDGPAALPDGPGIRPGGVLVSLGGDIAVAGPAPAGGWPIGLALDHADPVDPAGPSVGIVSGGLATSSTAVRSWQRGGEDLHHIVDPRTGRPATARWAAVTVAAGSCLDANIASCAAILLGDEAPGWLEQRRLPARLVDRDGGVRCVAGWPAAPQPVEAGAR